MSAQSAAAYPDTSIAANKKTLIYVGGLDEAVDDKVLTAAFRPFGELQQVLLPKDAASQKHRGFAFVEFQLAEDAAAALENMHDSELFGRVLKCNLAKPGAAGRGASGAIWAGDAADAWYGNTVAKSADEVDAAMQHAANQEAKSKA